MKTIINLTKDSTTVIRKTQINNTIIYLDTKKC